MVEFEGQGPILQQLQKFATASLIVAPHGAGLSNIMVSPLHTPVLEIGPSGCSICYMHLAVKVSAHLMLYVDRSVGWVGGFGFRDAGG